MRFACVSAFACLMALVAAPAGAQRPIPDTTGAVHVWDDQLPDSMSDAQIAFVARHVDGTQKVSRQTAMRLRSVNPGFLVLHYRLGIGDGPVPFRIGSQWASDYASVRRHGSWFYRDHGRRVLNRQSNWYVMNPSSGWRGYWASRVLYEASLLGDDGVFADSLSVPQYLGADNFMPPFHYFVGEAAWTNRINAFMRYEKSRLRGRLYFIPNAGSWITTRDRTDYGIPDGVMIEGFAEGDAQNTYAPSDWQLEMNRMLGLVRGGRVVIAQSYLQPSDDRARGFVLASYLLTRGSHSFLNMDIGSQVQWFPEYGVNLGAALDPLPGDMSALASGRLYARRFERGVAVVNPDATAHSYAVPETRWLVVPRGGGTLDAGADTSGWGLESQAVTGSLRLEPHSGAVLLDRPAA